MPSTPHLIPLVSDTQSKPTPAMRTAIANAEVGDEQRGEDPTANRLQARVAELLGKDAALWFPGGTMCNFVAIKVHTQPADAVVDWMAHSFVPRVADLIAFLVSARAASITGVEYVIDGWTVPTV